MIEIDLVSDDSDSKNVVELLSSPVQDPSVDLVDLTVSPIKPTALNLLPTSSSPLRQFEPRLNANSSTLTHESINASLPPVEEPLVASNGNDLGSFGVPDVMLSSDPDYSDIESSRRRKAVKRRNAAKSSAIAQEIGSDFLDQFEQSSSQNTFTPTPVETPIATPIVTPTPSLNEPSQEQDLIDELNEPVKPKRKGKRQFAPPKPKRAKSVSSTSSNAEPSVSVVRPLTDRKRCGAMLVCDVYNDKCGLLAGIQQTFGMLKVKTRLNSCQTPALESSSLDGVLGFVAITGNFKDEYDSVNKQWVETQLHTEVIPCVIVVLSASTLEPMLERVNAAFFDEIKNAVNTEMANKYPKTTELRLVYIVPDLAAVVKKRRAKHSRIVRKNVKEGNQEVCSNELSSLVSSSQFTELEIELQALYNVDITFPRVKDEFVELVANMVLDLGLQRYSNVSKQAQGTDASTKVNSKGTTLAATIQALMQIQGLKPRIAAPLGSDSQNIGNLLARINSFEQFGRGVWCDSLRRFLTSVDENEFI